MFRRRWSALPPDVSFPSDLKSLGYFVNDEDEIRSIDDPQYYFKFFLNKNQRINACQRLRFNHALEAIVHERLEKEGLKKILLPLGATVSEAHVPVFADGLSGSEKSRVVVIFGEPGQDLGLIAGRVANGRGGINKGSMVSVVRALRKQVSFADDETPPKIVLANTGQLYWSPEEMRAMTINSSTALPLPSLVHFGKRHRPEINCIPQNEDAVKHVQYVFENILDKEGAAIDVFAIGESCELVETYLDANWQKWQTRLGSMVLFGGVCMTDSLTNPGFVDFLAKRTRGYHVSSEPLDSPLAGPAGNPDLHIAPLGYPCYSSSEPEYTETAIIACLGSALSYIQEVALAEDYKNPEIVIAERPEEPLTEETWDQVPDEDRPLISVADPQAVKEELKQRRRWRKFEETGRVPNSDSDSDSEEELEHGSSPREAGEGRTW